MDGMDGCEQYRVHGSRVRWAVSQLRGQGIPFAMRPGDGGIYIILVPAGYGPALAGAPWVHQGGQGGLSGQGGLLVQIAVAVLILVVAWFGFQAAPVLLAGLSGEAVAVEEEKGGEGEGESGSNPLAAALDAVLSVPDRVSGEIDRRVDEAKQEVQEAMFNTAMTFCGAPLLVVFGGLALLLVLRMVRRR